jgi:ubiquinone/menaquinone biosynthesis C-methylase UbiE
MRAPDARTAAKRRLRKLLEPTPVGAVDRGGYLDLLGEAPQAGPTTGIAQRLMRTSAIPRVYEDWWRPALGRVAKGVTGPSMAEEHRVAADLLALSPGDVVLDVACGTGAFTRSFADLVGPRGLAIGLDASRSMLDRADRETAADRPVAFLRADAVRPPFVPARLDAVCCFAALHLFDEPETALSSFAALLKPGGRLALLTSARRNGFPLHQFDGLVGAAGGMRMFGRGEVAALLRPRGFKDVTERFHGVVQFVGARRSTVEGTGRSR